MAGRSGPWAAAAIWAHLVGPGPLGQLLGSHADTAVLESAQEHLARQGDLGLWMKERELDLLATHPIQPH